MPNSLQRRLDALEAANQARQERVYNCVMHQLTDAELACFCAYVKRVYPRRPTVTSEVDVRVLCRVERLTQADAEARPCDLLNVPREWMEEADHAE